MSAIALEQAAIRGAPALFVLVFLPGLPVPIPASLLILFAGALAAAGAMPIRAALVAPRAGVFWGIRPATGPGGAAQVRCGGCWHGGGRGPLVAVAEACLRENAGAALFLSRWLITPIAPYVTLCAGAAQVGWVLMTAHSLAGRAIWVAGYAGIGWVFADALDVAGATVGQTVLAITLFALGLVALRLGIGAWRHRRAAVSAASHDRKASSGGQPTRASGQTSQ